MNIESLREYCLKKKFVKEEFPFGDSALVFKVKGKIFLIARLDQSPLEFNIKSDPDKAVERREEFDAIRPGYHMNKKHWNTILVDGTLKDNFLQEMIDESYALIVSSLKREDQKGLV
jgi:predicted DNA-binding protein (MmcQ/YjbR family)